MGKKSFTLLELVAVIAVIGILASIALPVYTRAKEATYDREAIASLRIIKAAQQIFYSDHGYYWSDNWCFTSPTSNINANFNLHINLPTALPLNWTYCFTVGPGGSSFLARASHSCQGGYCCIYGITNSTDVERFGGSCRTNP